MSQSPQLLGRLSAEQFLREFWQKKPLLIRQALPNFTNPLSPEELAGLACEEGVEARLVQEEGGAKPWELRHGPFSEDDFLTLADTHWILLVQDVEKQVPDFGDILEFFRFIPDWRVDDLMISYAATHGSVGPHMDNYDVFLLQGMGRRRWQINSHASEAGNLRADTDLRILKDFSPEQEWVLERGDVLYLPPGVAHHGVALEPCMTYSVGFRAPGYHEMISGFIDFLMEEVDPNARYADPDLALQDNPGEIAPATFVKIKDLLQQHLVLDDSLIESWFGRFITESKAQFDAEPLDEPLSATDLVQYLDSGGVLERNPGSRFAYVDHGKSGASLFVAGQEFVLGPSIAFLASLLCQHQVFSRRLLRNAVKESSARELLLDLINEGYLVIYEDD